MAAARATGADAVHPGYGFLAENGGFARAVTRAGLVWIGPPADAIDLMGDKIHAKRAVAARGVPVVPSWEPGDPGIEFPVLVKPSAGGGGKGMRLVERADDLAPALEAAAREARAAFGDGTLMVERFVARPRHIEMQIFADSSGACAALGERECSLQRRHQKIVEEAPSPLLDAATRRAMGDSAVEVARACGYVGAGTVEFIVSADRPGEYFFMEMNTRLQVEHPVTEMVLGVDLVEWQLNVAAGAPLPPVPPVDGHAVEGRVYAEDADRGFLPATGRVLALREPAGLDGVRVDSALSVGLEVGTAYDPMLAKVVAWGPDREAALRRLDAALAETAVLGVTTNVGFLRRLLQDPAVKAGDMDTGLVERLPADPDSGPPDGALIAAAVSTSPPGSVSDPWARADGWRLGDAAPRRSRWRSGPAPAESEVHLTGREAAVDGRSLGPVSVWTPSATSVAVECAGTTSVYDRAGDGDDVWLARGGRAWRLTRVRQERSARAGAARGPDRVTSPMPGTVLSVHVEAGQSVEAGAQLVVVEAMKMEHTVRAAHPGTVAEILVKAGDPVRLDQPLLVLQAEPA